jgi:hypothetical protein
VLLLILFDWSEGEAPLRKSPHKELFSKLLPVIDGEQEIQYIPTQLPLKPQLLIEVEDE